MLGLLKKLFRPSTPPGLCVEAYWCDTSVKLSSKIRTPLGGSVSVLKVCLDIWYSVDGERIVLSNVRLSRSGGQAGSTSVNLSAERTGEAWFSTLGLAAADLVPVVEADLASANSRLRRIMLGKWKGAIRPQTAERVATAINSGAPSANVASLIDLAGRGAVLRFQYTKPNGQIDERVVTVEGVLGDSLRARDQKDGRVKSFRFDRMAKVRQK